MTKTNQAISPRNERAPDETLDVAQAAAFCHIGYEAMRELIDSGKVPAASLNQKHTVVLIDDLREFIRNLAREQAEERRRLFHAEQASARAQERAAREPKKAAAKAGRPPARPALPDLKPYELTTSEPQGSTPEDSRSA